MVYYYIMTVVTSNNPSVYVGALVGVYISFQKPGKLYFFLFPEMRPKFTIHAPFLASLLHLLYLFYTYIFNFLFLFCLFSFFSSDFPLFLFRFSIFFPPNDIVENMAPRPIFCPAGPSLKNRYNIGGSGLNRYRTI